MDEVDTVRVLSGIPFFAEVLDDAQLEALAHKSHPTFFPTGSVLMTEGDFGVSMFVIVEGTVGVTLTDRFGDAHGVAVLSAGDVVGEMSLMTGARRSATVTATTDVTALEVTKFSLEAILRQAPDLIDAFGAVLATRKAELDRIAAEAEHSHEDIVVQIRRFFPSIFGGKARA